MSETSVNAKVTTRKPIYFSDENIKVPATSDNSLNLKIDYLNNPKFRAEFHGDCLKTDISFLLMK